jgi:hypothetical protein
LTSTTNLKVVSISTKRKRRIAKFPWVYDKETLPPELELVVLAWYETDEEGNGDWNFSLGFYDNRGIWINEEGKLLPKPDVWALVTEPTNDE